jgi:hypothetical protein
MKVLRTTLFLPFLICFGEVWETMVLAKNALLDLSMSIGFGLRLLRAFII